MGLTGKKLDKWVNLIGFDELGGVMVKMLAVSIVCC